MATRKPTYVKRIVNAVAIENTLIVGQTSRYIIVLDDSYPTVADLTGANPLVRATNGQYFIKYEPPGSYHGKIGDLPFVIGNDMVGFRFKTKNSDHFRKIASIFPEVAWMIRNTNYNDYLFAVAQLHPGMIVPFCLDVSRYVNNLIEQAKKTGMDIKKIRPLVTFKTSADKINCELNSDRCFSPSHWDYSSELKKARKLADETV